MTTNIEVFYSFQSPYSYIALESLYDLANNFDIEVLWQPFSAKASGQSIQSQSIIPDKLSYLFDDTKRFAEEKNMPLVYPDAWPEAEFDPSRMTRGALIANDMGFLMEYNYKVFHKWWGLGEDPNDENFMNELCDELDVDLGEFLSKSSSSDTRERVKGIYRRGRKLGVFDTPTMMLDKERFVGIDKIPYLAQRLTDMGLMVMLFYVRHVFVGRNQDPENDQDERRDKVRGHHNAELVFLDGQSLRGVHAVDNLRIDRLQLPQDGKLADKESDLAVVQLDGAADLPTLALRDSNSLEVGDLVLAVGNPFGVGQTVTTGIISATARTDLQKFRLRALHVIQRDQALTEIGPRLVEVGVEGKGLAVHLDRRLWLAGLAQRIAMIVQ